MIFAKIPRIVFMVLYFELIFLNSIVFAYFYLQFSELNEIKNFLKITFPDFLTGKGVCVITVVAIDSGLHGV
jgi:hypothetical protein